MTFGEDEFNSRRPIYCFSKSAEKELQELKMDFLKLSSELNSRVSFEQMESEINMLHNFIDQVYLSRNN